MCVCERERERERESSCNVTGDETNVKEQVPRTFFFER